MRRTSLIVIASCLLASFAAAQESRPAGGAMASGPAAVTVPTFHNETCPVMGKPAKADVFVETDHGRVYLCCKNCVKKVEADKEGMYKKAYATTKKAGNKTCPSTGEPVDGKSTVTIQGLEIGLCCSDCAKPVLENSQISLAKVKNPKLNDLGNKTDPISGKPVCNNFFCLIGDDLVHLSCADSAAEVMKDPKKALEKAKASKPNDPPGGMKPKEGEKKGGPHEAGGCCSGGGDGEKPACCSGASKAKAIAESQPAK